MLIAGAVCPHPPLLIPAALGSAASDPPAELRKVAGAAAHAVSGLADARPDLIVVVGGGTAEREHGPGASGGLHAFGVGVTVGPGEPVLPLPLTVGRWLLERAGILARDGAPGPEGGVVGAGAGPPGEAGASLPGGPAGLPCEPAGISGEAASVPGEAVSLPGAGAGDGEVAGGGIAVVFQEVARNAA